MYDDTVQNTAKMETGEIPSILTSEVERALSQMKSRKAPGEEQIVVEMIRAGVDIALIKIQGFFKAVLRTEAVPKEWRSVIITLTLKKEIEKTLPTTEPSNISTNYS